MRARIVIVDLTLSAAGSNACHRVTPPSVCMRSEHGSSMCEPERIEHRKRKALTSTEQRNASEKQPCSLLPLVRSRCGASGSRRSRRQIGGRLPLCHLRNCVVEVYASILLAHRHARVREQPLCRPLPPCVSPGSAAARGWQQAEGCATVLDGLNQYRAMQHTALSPICDTIRSVRPR